MSTLNSKKVVNAWCMYDWANSVYSLSISTAIFPMYYGGVAEQISSDKIINVGSQSISSASIYSFAVSLSFLFVIFSNLILSGIADASGKKKAFLKIFTTIGSFGCVLLYFFTPNNFWFGIITFMIATIGYAGSLVFYNAYLPEIVSPDKQDQVSARGYSFGYIGSVILLIVNLVLVLNAASFGLSKAQACQISFVMVGIWWFTFALIPFKFLPSDKKQSFEFKIKILLKGFKELSMVYKQLKKHKDIPKYLFGFFFYSIGIQTIMYLATLFGTDELKLPAEGLIKVVLIIQLVAVGGAFVISKLSAKIGNVKTLIICVLTCIGICVGAYNTYTEFQFNLLAVLVGFMMGGIQSLSRSTYSKMLPISEDHASFFSVYEFTEKLGIVIGTATFGIITHLLGMRNSILALIFFFIISIAILMSLIVTKKRLQKSGL